MRARLAAVLTAPIVAVLSSCYVTVQGSAFLRDQARSRPVERIREPTATERELFTRVEEIRTYAEQELGLSAGRNYTTFVRTDKGHLVSVVSATRAESFTPKVWRFPVVGAVPYKGFYREKSAIRLARRLSDQGYDVYLRRVDAFSSLGYFRDPLYSFMVGYSDARLTELIIHEMAHATLWIKDGGDFNEQFATFVGREGTRRFLTARRGEEAAQAYLSHLVDRDTFRDDINRLRADLEALYAAGLPREETLANKQETIARFARAFAGSYDERYRSQAYRAAFDGRMNNAYIDLWRTYTSGLDRFYGYLEEHDDDLRATIGWVISNAEHIVHNREP